MSFLYLNFMKIAKHILLNYMIVFLLKVNVFLLGSPKEFRISSKSED